MWHGVQPAVRKYLLTFVAIAASTTLVVSAPGSGPNGSEVRQRTRLAAQAAEVPVPRPLPLDTSGPLGAAPASPVPSAATAVPITPPPEGFVSAAPARAAAPAQLRSAVPASTGLPGTWAVVIGINDYPGSQYDLNYAVNDANDASQALSLQGVSADHVLNLREGQVTRDVLKSSATWLIDRAGPDAVAVFFYAGHVMKKAGAEAIVTADGATVTDRDLAAWLRPLAARQTWITIAACYGGGFDELLAPGRVLTAAAGANDVAYESSAFGRSYLGEYMVRRAMIEGAANDTVQTAFAWARSRINQDYSGREPVQFDHTDGRLSLRPPGASAATSQSSSPPVEQSPTPQPEEPASPPRADEMPPPKKCSGIIVLNC
jgi:hypothetical protein